LTSKFASHIIDSYIETKEEMMRAQIVWNSKYNKYDGVLNGKVLSRCAQIGKVSSYFAARNIEWDITKEVSPRTILPSVLFGAKTDDSVRDRLRVEVAEVLEHAKKIFGNKINLNPEVKFYSRGTIAGKAHYRDMSVAFNEVLAKENPTEFNNTVIHEVTHLIVKQVYPSASAHGFEFKHVMQSLCGNGKRCHSYDVSSVKEKRSYTYYIVKCSCSEHKLSKQKAAKASILRCKKCHSNCTNTGKTVVVTK
jgi:predicted SprT family Zn-dependent metalloprotease